MNRRVEFLLFAAGWGANHFATLLVVYRKELGFSPSALGLLFGAYALGLVPGLVLAGRASDAWGRRALVLPASVFAIVASAVLAFGSHGFGVLLAGRLLFGLAMGSVMSPGSVWVQELVSADVGPRRATLALSAGFGLGPLVTGLIAQFAPAPMVLPYVVHAGVMTIGVLGARAVPETVPGAARSGRDEAANAGSVNGPPAHASASAHPEADGGARAIASAAASASAGANREQAQEASPIQVLAQLLPVAPWAFGFAAMSLAVLPGIMRPHVARPILYSAFVVVTTLFCGVTVQPLTTRIGRRADLVGLAVGALGLFCGAFAVSCDSPNLVFAAAALAGAGYGLVITTGLREVSERVPRRARGTVVGVYYVLTYVGFALPFAHAVVAQRWGDVATLNATAALALACLVVRAGIEARSSWRPATAAPLANPAKPAT